MHRQGQGGMSETFSHSCGNGRGPREQAREVRTTRISMLMLAAHLLTLAAAVKSPGDAGTGMTALTPTPADLKIDTGEGNPLAGLPALPKIHHSYTMCRPGPPGVMPWKDCAFPVDSNSALQLDFARITHAWALAVAFNAGGYPAHTAAGVPIWNNSIFAATQNKTEVVEATRLCAKVNASITINYSPWATWWGSSKLYCPTGPNDCDPTIRGTGEELELRFFRQRMANIVTWIAETNAELGSSVHIGAVALDCEQFLINWANETQLRALERKDDLIYNVSREFCDPALGCTVEQYNRGTIGQEKTLAKPAEGIPADDAWTPWPGYPACLGLGDTFATSLYTVPECECAPRFVALYL